MFDFGDELILGNYRIPWLIWIQLVVTFLLIILLYYFCFFALDLSDRDIITSISSNPTSTTTITTTSTCLLHHHHKVGESQSVRGEVETSSSRRIVRGADIREREGVSTKNATHFAVSENCYHPCYYIELAKQAFLKCFGLGDCSSTREQNKED